MVCSAFALGECILSGADFGKWGFWEVDFHRLKFFDVGFGSVVVSGVDVYWLIFCASICVEAFLQCPISLSVSPVGVYVR